MKNVTRTFLNFWQRICAGTTSTKPTCSARVKWNRCWAGETPSFNSPTNNSPPAKQLFIIINNYESNKWKLTIWYRSYFNSFIQLLIRLIILSADHESTVHCRNKNVLLLYYFLFVKLTHSVSKAPIDRTFNRDSIIIFHSIIQGRYVFETSPFKHKVQILACSNYENIKLKFKFGGRFCSCAAFSIVCVFIKVNLCWRL